MIQGILERASLAAVGDALEPYDPKTRAADPVINEQPKTATDRQLKQEPGLRYDAGKPRFELIPADSLQELTNVYTRGALMYADRNWEKGMSWSRCFGSLMRHSWAFWRGETNDPETGLHHMAHAAWNCLALCSYDLRKAGTDDRPEA